MEAAENYALQFLLLHCSLRHVFYLLLLLLWLTPDKSVGGVKCKGERGEGNWGLWVWVLCIVWTFFGLMLITKTALALG